MKRVLYVSFYFPPVGAIASLRALKMVKYLSRMGYQVDVVCASPLLIKAPHDLESVVDIPAAVSVHRALYLDPAWLYKLFYGLRLPGLVRWMDRKLFFPGSESLWLPFAKRKLIALINSGRSPDVAILSSGPPAVLKLVEFLSHNYNIPSVIDWRDEWTNNPELLSSRSLPQASKRELDLERSALASSSGCVYLSTRMRDNFFTRYDFLRQKAAEVIPNGFDEEDYDNLVPMPPRSDNRLRICYSGSFYDRRQPDPLWQALSELSRSQLIDPERISIEIRGNNQSRFVLGSYADDTMIRGMVRLLPYLPYRQNLRQMFKADVLLLYIPSGINTDSVLTGKIFEYLRASKPVLAIIPPAGEAASILKDAGIGFIAADTDPEGIKARILEIWQAWQQGNLSNFRTDPQVLLRYSRSSQARKMAALIDRVSNRHVTASLSMKKPKALLILPNRVTFTQVDEELLQDICRLHVIDLKQKSSRLKYLFNTLSACFNIMIQKPDLILVWFADYHAALTVMASRLRNVKSIVFIGGYDAVCYPEFGMGVYCSPLRAWCARTALKNCGLIIANHEALVSSDNLYYNPKGHPEGIHRLIPTLQTPARVIYNSLTLSPPLPRQLNSLRQNKFLCVGTTPRYEDVINKGYDLVAQVARQHPEWQFEILGFDPRWKSRFIDEFGLKCVTNLKLRSHLPHNAVLDLMLECKWFIQASISEGMPNALMEAMLMGCVPIGSKVAGIPTLIDDLGVVFDRRDPASLEQALIKATELIVSPSDISTRIANRFARHNRHAALSQAVEDLLAGRP